MPFKNIPHPSVVLCSTILALMLHLSYIRIFTRRVETVPIFRKGVTKIERESPIYVVGAYLIRENFLRVILLQDCRRPTKILATFVDGENVFESVTMNLTAINQGCPYTNNPPCVFDGMYAEFEFSTKFIGQRATLSAERDNQTSSTSITIRRSVPSGQRRHHLAVCLPALFYYTDTVQLIEFIENWLLAGATKFFIYWQAITSHVKEILNFYKDSGVDIELITWPRLTSENADLTMYYTGQIVSINDCLHRARSDAEFAAAVDLDELIAVSNETDLIALLNTSAEYSAGWLISRVHSLYVNTLSYASDARELSLTPLKEILSDRQSVPYEKLILRPQNVRRRFVHWINELEPLAAPTERLPAEYATLIHLRSMPFEYSDQENYTVNSVFDNIAVEMTENWNQRLSSAAKGRWQNVRLTRTIETVQLIEDCLLKIKSRLQEICFTASYCVSILLNNSSTAIDWQYPEEKWIEI